MAGLMSKAIRATTQGCPYSAKSSVQLSLHRITSGPLLLYETEHVRVFEDWSVKMKHSERLEIFEKVRARYSVFLLSVLWKLTGDTEKR